MLTKLVKIGDEYAVIISDELLESIGASSKSSFETRIDGNCIAISPVKPDNSAE